MLPVLDLTALKSVNMEVLNEFILKDKKMECYSLGRAGTGILLRVQK